MKAVRKVKVTQDGHRHLLPGTHEHEFEPQYGLPERLPDDERVLWQGSPDWRALAITRFHVRKVAIYFAVLLAWRIASLVHDGMAPWPAVSGSVVLFSASALALACLAALAWFSARNTVYTLTDKRVVMRIGIVLTLTLNLPFKRIESAALHLMGRDGGPHGLGDIALALRKPDRIAFLNLWPHARRWRLSRPEPALLCVPRAEAVARLLTDAWRAHTGEAGLPVQAAADSAAAPALEPQRA